MVFFKLNHPAALLKTYSYFCFSLLGTVCCLYPFHCEELQFEPSMPFEHTEKKGIMHKAYNIPVIIYQDCFYFFLQCYIIGTTMTDISTLVVLSSAAMWADKFSFFMFKEKVFCPLIQWIQLVPSTSQIIFWKIQALKMHPVVNASLPRETTCKY